MPPTLPDDIAEIAAKVGTTDPEPGEPLHDFCMRLRAGIEEYGEVICAELDDMILDLDEFEAELEDQSS
jgi:hypothetical protein